MLFPVGYKYTLIFYEGVGIGEGSSLNDYEPHYNSHVEMWKNSELVYNESAAQLVYFSHNNMTNAGKNWIDWDLFNSSYTQQRFYNISIGTGTQSGNVHAATALTTYLASGSSTFYSPTGAAGSWGMNYTFSFGGSYTIKEAGVCAVTYPYRLVFYINNTSVAVTSTDTLKVSWQGTTSGY